MTGPAWKTRSHAQCENMHTFPTRGGEWGFGTMTKLPQGTRVALLWDSMYPVVRGHVQSQLWASYSTSFRCYMYGWGPMGVHRSLPIGKGPAREQRMMLGSTPHSL